MPRLVKLQRAEKQQKITSNYKVTCVQQNKNKSTMWQLSRHNISIQIRSRQFLSETEYYPFKKKRVLSDSIPGPLPSQAYSLTLLGENSLREKV